MDSRLPGEGYMAQQAFPGRRQAGEKQLLKAGLPASLRSVTLHSRINAAASGGW